MVTLLLRLLRLLPLLCGAHRHVALENLALRHQLAVYKKTVTRLIGSIWRECLNHVLVLGESHVRRILARYFSYYHRARTHLALDKDAPDVRPVELPEAGRIVEIPEVGGLHHRYVRAA